jgi:hypothetical protein
LVDLYQYGSGNDEVFTDRLNESAAGQMIPVTPIVKGEERARIED